MASAASEAVVTMASGVKAPRNICRIMGLSSTSKTLTLLAMGRVMSGTGADIVATLAAGLALEHDFANFDALVQRLAHIVHSESGDAGSHQSFHLHARGRSGRDL